MIVNTTAPRSRRRLTRPTDVSARLVVVHPRECAGQHALSAQPAVLGRGDAAVALGHASVSRRHAEVAWDEQLGAHRARDLDSRHGTCVDGAPVPQWAELRDGSVLRLADVVLVYEVARAAPQAAPTPAVPGDSFAAGELRAAIARAAADDAPALILGETGTGKESVAAELHRLSGRRGRLLAINCAALSPQLVESQLFGHQKGAFTGADQARDGLFRAAEGGTLLLDEIGELPLELQPKLLRVLQEREVMPVGATSPLKVDVRVVAATNRPLGEADPSRFRRDLYARLALFELRVPALRERRADLMGWLELLHRRWRAEQPGPVLPPFEGEAVEAMLLASWPENLRTLDRFVHGLASKAAPAEVTAAELPGWLGLGLGSAGLTRRAGEPRAQGRRARRPNPSREELLAALAEHKSIRAVARHFERDRRQIYRWLEQLGIPWNE